MITRLRIADMPAVHAIRGVSTALTAVEGITAVDIRLGTAVVEHDGRATPQALREALEAAGYVVEQLENEPRRLNVSPLRDSTSSSP